MVSTTKYRNLFLFPTQVLLHSPASSLHSTAFQLRNDSYNPNFPACKGFHRKYIIARADKVASFNRNLLGIFLILRRGAKKMGTFVAILGFYGAVSIAIIARFASINFGPIPLTSANWSTLVKPPISLRC